MDINSKLKEVAQYRMMKAQVIAELDALEEEVKAYMQEQGIEVLIGDEHKVTFKEVVSDRFDSKAFKKDHADLYDEYTKPSSSMRFTFA